MEENNKKLSSIIPPAAPFSASDIKILKEYEAMVPGVTAKLMNLAEKQMEHKHNLDKKRIEIEIDLNKKDQKLHYTGLLLAFLLGIIGILAGLFLSLRGAQISGSIIGCSGVIGMLASVNAKFIFKKKQDKKEEGPNDNT